MGKILVGLLLTALLLSGCSAAVREVDCNEIAAAYEAAGYEVFHQDPSALGDFECYMVATDEKTGESIYFHRFPTAVEAESYADARQYNVLLWGLSVLYGDPSWLHTTTYGVYEIEYDNDALYEPFADLIG